VETVLIQNKTSHRFEIKEPIPPATSLKKILFVTSEAVPFAKTGGLGDVCGVLPKFLKERGHDVRIVMPRYWAVNADKHNLKPLGPPMGVSMNGSMFWCQILEGELDGVPVYFIEHQNFFGRAGLYDSGYQEYSDNPIRFGFLSRAALQVCQDLKFKPDIIHCHDWQTALVPAYLKTAEFHNPFFADTATVLSIHNIAYQGVFEPDSYPALGLGGEHFTEAKFESYGRINFMKGGIFFADAVGTVSPTHAREMLTPEGGQGLHDYLKRRGEDFIGILNGVDYEDWNPETDLLIPQNYSAEDLSGKAVCKEALQREFQLKAHPRIPIIGIVSRLVNQKGLDVLAPVIESIIYNMRVQFAILGSGEKWIEDFFGGLPARYPGRVGAWIGYDERKAHLIEAGADFFLMPSLYEPCGLNQIYSLKYGTLPIVRSTGGLVDTVEQYNEEDGSGTGFRFLASNGNGIYYTVGWAVSTYYDRPHHIRKMQERAMKTNFCWMRAVLQYELLYEKALERRKIWR